MSYERSLKAKLEILKVAMPEYAKLFQQLSYDVEMSCREIEKATHSFLYKAAIGEYKYMALRDGMLIYEMQFKAIAEPQTPDSGIFFVPTGDGDQ